MQVYSARLGHRASSLLAAVTLAVLAGTATVAGFAMRDRIAAWCRGVAEEIVRIDLATALLAAVLCLAALSFAVASSGDALAARRLRRAIGRSAVPPSGRLQAALAAVGADAGRVVAVRDRRPYAYAVGILRPRVVISSALVAALTLEELKAVLAHELRHLAERHPLHALVWELARRTFFFLPALRDLSEHFALSRELAADRAALEVAGRRPLASAMLKAVSPSVPGVAAFVPFGHLHGRIEALHGERGARLQLDAVRVAVTALAIVSTMSAAVPARADAPPVPYGSCRAEFDRQMSALIAPLTRAFPPGPSSDADDVQSREIGP